MDPAAFFEEVFESAKDSIYRICCCYLRDPEDRRDAFQEVALRLYQHAGSFRGDSAPKTWAYRITVNTCLDLLRAQRRRTTVVDGRRRPDLPDVADDGRQSDQVEAALDAEKLYAAVLRLPVLDRTLVSLYLEDASMREIGDVLGISEVNARVRLHRSREALRRMLEGANHGTR